MAFVQFLERFGHGLGFPALWASHKDVKLLLVTRMIRLFAIGGATSFLPTYLSDLGFSDATIGLFMALTLIGDLFIGVILACIGDRLGFRVTIITGCLLMSASGVVFALCDNYWVLLLASIAGVISPIASEIGPFKTVEESAIARLMNPDDRIDIFAWRGLLGLMGAAGGVLLTGLVLDTIRITPGYHTFHIIFFAYSGLEAVKLLLCLCLSPDIEPKHSHSDGKKPIRDTEEYPGEQSLLLAHDDCEKPESFHSVQGEGKASKRGLLGFAPESAAFMWRFCLTTFLDYVANGMALISWMTYFFKRQYHVSEGTLGLVIFAASVFSALGALSSSPLARQIGRVPTMVLCHNLHSIALMMVSVPKSKSVALGLLMFRISTRELDSAPSLSFVTSSVRDDEITAAIGIINVAKIIGSSVGLFLTGRFTAIDQFWVALTIAGGLKLVYNGLIAGFFWNHDNDL